MTGPPRRLTGNDADWRPAVLQVVAAATAEDGRAPVNEGVLLGLEHHGLDGGSLYAADDGYALVRHGALDLAVHPRSRRMGLGTALLDAALADHPGVPLTAWSHVNHPAAARLAATHGFRATRELWLMRRPPADVAVVEPRGSVRIRTFQPDGDEPAFLRVNAAAFADHPEQGALTLDGLRERMAEPWFDPAGFFVAEHDGRLVGYHWTKVHPDGTGEVYVVGVAPEAQGLGLGRALVTRGLAHLQPRPVTLYVEADNRAAIALYASLGFGHAASDTDVQYSRGPGSGR